jgi:PAS domain S-box-containing protein
MVVSVIITIWNSMVINSSLVKRIAELREGFEIMGAGNLDHRLGVKGGDELSALAKAGNEMAGKLKESHTSVTNLNREIAERKNAEEKLSRLYETLEKSEERFRLLVEQAPEAIAVFDVDENRFIQVNSQAEKLFGCSRKDLLTSGAQQFYTPIQPNGRSLDESRKENIERALAGEEVVIERAIHNAEGKELICELRLVRFPSADRRLIRNSYVDVTERKQSGEKVKASLREKETMLKEIHHRVKNNLQVIQSLLNLQARKIKDPQALEVINQSRDRIRAMALVHEKLYQSPDLAQIDMTDYLQGLSISLFHSSQVSPNKVKLKLEMEEVQLGINEAIPLGLILNELISNALKHAFPGGREGEIRVGLALVDEGLIRLSVRDNGIGLPGEVGFREAESLGFQVVSALVEQLSGSIELDREVGTEFRITFREGIK